MEKTASITIRISETEKEVLKMLADMDDVPMSQLIRQAIRDYIEKNR